jgi:CubicO group peptidase (beta-lactamase class C family)
VTQVDAGFEPVADELAAILAENPEAGAAFAAFRDGEPVVDLWGGVADAEAGTPWGADTAQLVFSGTKGFVAVCVLLLIDRGAIELDAPVSRYWPAFAAAGKERITVAQVVSHQAGLPGLRGGFGPRDLLDQERMIARVAAEPPFWEPGTRLAYHALTFGWLCDGLVRVVDGRSAGRFFADEAAAPLGLELWIGTPPELTPRIARLVPAADHGITYLGDEPEPLLDLVFGSSLSGRVSWNDPAFREAEIPAANAIGTVRSIARLYGCLARGGEIDGVRLLSEDTVLLGRTELSRGLCAITRRPYAFGVGFELHTELGRLGPCTDAFGHTGSGGSSHGAWPGARVGFSFATNDLQAEARDRRAPRLLAALARSVNR